MREVNLQTDTKCPELCEDALGRAENAIGNLPSVQPEKHTEERA